MEWLATIRRAISFMEDHLLDDISAQDVADETNMSSFFLQRGFSAITGYGIAEYLRNRRLYEAAKELKETDEKIMKRRKASPKHSAGFMAEHQCKSEIIKCL